MLYEYYIILIIYEIKNNIYKYNRDLIIKIKEILVWA